MYEILKSEKEVNGVKVETWKREIWNANALEIEVGTTGYQGGDSGHGGRTYLRINDLASTDIDVNILKDTFGNISGFELKLGGDAELTTFIEALEFALKVLKDQSRE
jgi:hypothetical protein